MTPEVASSAGARLEDVRLPLDARAFPPLHLAIAGGAVFLCILAGFALTTHDPVIAPYVASYLVGGVAIPVAYIYVVARWAARLHELHDRAMRSDIGVTGIPAEDFLHVLLWTPLMRVLVAATIVQVVAAFVFIVPLERDLPGSSLFFLLLMPLLLAPWTACLHLMRRFESNVDSRGEGSGAWWTSAVLLGFIHVLVGMIGVLVVSVLVLFTHLVIRHFGLWPMDGVIYFLWTMLILNATWITMVVFVRLIASRLARIAKVYFAAEE